MKKKKTSIFALEASLDNENWFVINTYKVNGANFSVRLVDLQGYPYGRVRKVSD